jgi:hypothetical protein
MAAHAEPNREFCDSAQHGGVGKNLQRGCCLQGTKRRDIIFQCSNSVQLPRNYGPVNINTKHSVGHIHNAGPWLLCADSNTITIVPVRALRMCCPLSLLAAACAPLANAQQFNIPLLFKAQFSSEQQMLPACLHLRTTFRPPPSALSRPLLRALRQAPHSLSSWPMLMRLLAAPCQWPAALLQGLCRAHLRQFLEPALQASAARQGQRLEATPCRPACNLQSLAAARRQARGPSPLWR